MQLKIEQLQRIVNKIQLRYTDFMAKEENYTIQSVDRALLLLRDIAYSSPNGRSLAELTGVLNIDRSSVFRLLTTLGKHDLIRQDEAGKRYKLGYGIYSLAGALRVQDKITLAAQPFLHELVEKTGENAHLAVRSRKQCVFIDREAGTQTLTANTDIGSTEELYCTAVGKSLLAGMSREGVAELYGGEILEAFTRNTITDLEEVYEELQRVAQQGYAMDNEEYEPNVICCAGPVYNYLGEIEAAIGISGPKIRMENRKEETAVIVRDICHRLSVSRGYEKKQRKN